MRHSFTAVLSRNERLIDEFDTEPYEVGWAQEARVFIHVLEMSLADSPWDLKIQISPDGLFWCDLETEALSFKNPGLYTKLFTGFGNWVRITGKAKKKDSMLRPIIYLALKE